MTLNARARAHAFATVKSIDPVVASVSYRSRGQLLVIGPAGSVHRAGQILAGSMALPPVLLITDSSQLAGTVEDVDGCHCVHGAIEGLSGYLGNFKAQTDQEFLATALKLSLSAEQKAFDLVLDLQDRPLIDSEIPPPGYYAPRTSESALQLALEEIPTLSGEFEKPRYFSYDAAICAHGRSGVSACRRCIETCPTDAITSIGDAIEVDPNLCQGAGSCATSCPTGAIRYAYPSADETLRYWRSLLKAYREAGGERPILLIHDAQSGSEQAVNAFDTLADNVLPVEIEELGSAGMEAWLAALAWGADAVRLLSTPTVAPSVLKEVDFQLAVAAELVAALGYPGDRLERISQTDFETGDHFQVDALSRQSAGFAPLDEKRTLIGLAVDHLAAESGVSIESVMLPPGAPFGEIQVNAVSCTLCMACVSQCPANALAAGDERPQLRFIEANCVQCGLCSHSCPEQAITLSSRFLFDANKRRQMRTLNEDTPFCCISCNTPFATTQVIERMTEKMKDHPMFSGAALERLKMCGDCRVKDMMMGQAVDGLDAHSGDPQ